jgi:cell fate regulator YaaT (PSP1 superfamily)
MTSYSQDEGEKQASESSETPAPPSDTASQPVASEPPADAEASQTAPEATGESTEAAPQGASADNAPAEETPQTAPTPTSDVTPAADKKAASRQFGPTGKGDPASEAPLVCVRYGRMGMLGLFKWKGPAIQPHTSAVIKSDRGLEIGTVLCPANKQLEYEGRRLKRLGSIRRLATHDDLMEAGHLKQSEAREKTFCEERIKQAGLPMRLAMVEHLFGGDRIIFFFLSEGRVDFRELVKGLAQEYQTRIEMRQIGVRDEARLLADYERCGQPICCRMFIKEFQPVSMKMAKLQKATLDPSKISGRCGRLMCCLRYEYDTYEDLRKRLPKRNSTVMTEFGPGRVVGSSILTQLIKVDINGQTQIVPNEEITERNLREEDVQKWREEQARKSAPRSGRAGGSRRGRPQSGAASGDRQKTGEPSAGRSRSGSDAPRGRRSGGEPAKVAGEGTPGDSSGPAGQSGTGNQGDEQSPHRRKRRLRNRRGGGDKSGAERTPTGETKPDHGKESRAGGPKQDLGLPKKLLESLGVDSGGDTPQQGKGDGEKSGEPEKPHSHRGKRRSKRRRGGRKGKPKGDTPPPEASGQGDG